MLNFDKLIYLVLFLFLIVGILFNRKIIYVFLKIFCSIVMVVCCRLVLSFFIIMGAFGVFENNIILLSKIFNCFDNYIEYLLDNIKKYYAVMFNYFNNLVNIVLLTHIILLLLFLSFSLLVSYGIIFGIVLLLF